MANDQKPVISVRKLRKVYMMGQEHVVALHNIDLDIPRGEVCCIFGTSGSGKSTLLNQLAGLEKPTRGVVRIGDETGRLARTLDFLRDYYRKRAAQRRMVASAVNYPVVILAVAAAVVAFMLSVVVPMFEEVYARMGGELPALTRGIIALSKAFPAYAAVAVSAGGGLYLLYRANRQREEVQRWRTATLLRLPVAGEIIRKNMQAQCCKLLDLLCAAGVPLLAGVGMLREVIGFHPYRKSFDEIERRLERLSLIHI